jgi:prevent-host-death family protein
MKHMPAGKFKVRCLSVMDGVNATGEPVIITKRGIPVVKVVPVTSKKRKLFGFMTGEFKIVGDIERPLASEPARLSKKAADAIR